ncbi:uncharacterized protein LOC115880253 [Sitophilus oryzae]|uniref:Uncharacterized protein LOC115880253 n=1 Tax=Sitophilus oryzae TaxID=7048 RepID=A0A6J2XR35_SITOR|nr:uncharacterized protein LOC115880253 [Sitophilus oryzae]
MTTVWPRHILNTFPCPAIYAGDFNSPHTNWKYNHNNPNGEALVEWAEVHRLHLVYDAKNRASFRSAAWNREFIPDLTFVTCDDKGQPIDIARKLPRQRWNFRKANWSQYKEELENCIGRIPPKYKNYHRFTGLLKSIAKKHIPRGYRKEYIPGWSSHSEDLYKNFLRSKDPEIGDELLHSLDAARRTRWIETTESLNFQHSSRKAWSLLKKLGASNPVKREDPEANSTEECHLSMPFDKDEITEALTNIKMGKAPGFDGIHNEFLINTGPNVRQWLANFFTDILNNSEIAKDMKKAKIISVLKPGKPKDSPESYRPISLLSSCYKLLERLILERIVGIVNNCVPAYKAEFRPNRSCTDQRYLFNLMLLMVEFN